MKTITTIFVAVLLLTVNGYSQNTEVKTLLNKLEKRTEVFNTILGDHQLMMEFMTAMKGNEHAMMMMQSNNEMMENKRGMGMDKDNKMMGQGNMMGMMKDNPEMMQKMMGNMMQMCEKDTAMRNKMANMMTEHPEMMKMCMQKMKEKDMMNPDGKMMNKEEKSNHKNHKH